MFANKQKLQKIKCIITGQVKQCGIWFNCSRCCINYGMDIFREYDGYLMRPKCAICDGILVRKTAQLFPGHRRR